MQITVESTSRRLHHWNKRSSYPDKPSFSPVNQFSMSSLAPKPISAKLSYKEKKKKNIKKYVYITSIHNRFKEYIAPTVIKTRLLLAF